MSATARAVSGVAVRGCAPSVDRGQERPLIGGVDASVVAGEFVAVAGVHKVLEHVGAEIPVRESENFHPTPMHP